MRGVGRDPRTGKVIQYARNELTASLIMQYVANGAEFNDICIMLNMRPGVLKELYGRELDAGLPAANMNVASNVYRQAAFTPNIRAAELWMRNRAGWDKDQKKVDETPMLNIIIHGG